MLFHTADQQMFYVCCISHVLITNHEYKCLASTQIFFIVINFHVCKNIEEDVMCGSKLRMAQTFKCFSVPPIPIYKLAFQRC